MWSARFPRALRAMGDEVAVVVPRYGSIDLKRARRVYDGFAIYLGPARHDVSIYQAARRFPALSAGLPAALRPQGPLRRIRHGLPGQPHPLRRLRPRRARRGPLPLSHRDLPLPRLAGRPGARASAQQFRHRPHFLRRQDPLHHPQSGLPGPLSQERRWPKPRSTPSLFRPDGLEFFGSISYIKGGIAFADALNTVSPTYAREIQTPEYGFGLDGALRARADVLSGILNGVDYGEWNPETDPLIPARYSAADLAGKRVCKQRLLEEFGLPPDRHGPAR